MLNLIRNELMLDDGEPLRGLPFLGRSSEVGGKESDGGRMRPWRPDSIFA